MKTIITLDTIFFCG